MAQSFDPFEQAGRSRRLAHDSTDTNLRDRLPSSPMNTLRAPAMEDRETPIRNAGSDEPGLA